MKKTSRLFLLGALILVMLTAACGAEEGATPTLVGTSVPGEADLTSTPLGGDVETTQTAETETATTAETATAGGDGTTPTVSATAGVATQATTDGTAAAGTTRTPGIPVTGPDIILVECQFCVDTMAHALLVLPDTATFEVVSPPASTTTSTTTTNETNCSTVEVNNGKQVVLCSGPEMTPLTLNICTNGSTCTDFPVDLLACPLTQTNNTPSAPGTDTGVATSTPGGIQISTATPSTPVNTPTP